MPRPGYNMVEMLVFVLGSKDAGKKIICKYSADGRAPRLNAAAEDFHDPMTLGISQIDRQLLASDIHVRESYKLVLVTQAIKAR